MYLSKVALAGPIRLPRAGREPAGRQKDYPCPSPRPHVSIGLAPEGQLARQREWLEESWLWLLRTLVLDETHERSGRPTALDVGCGPGLVMELLSPFLDVQGVDVDPEAVRASAARGTMASVARAEELPFEDDAFDIVYCSYLLLWVDDPEVVVREMKRVSRNWVICLAEPDHSGRISYPEGLSVLDDLFVASIREKGADPAMGRRLRHIFAKCGLDPIAGVHANMWIGPTPKEETDAEWVSLTSGTDRESLAELQGVWERAAADGSLVQFNPVFYALARKGPVDQGRLMHE